METEMNLSQDSGQTKGAWKYVIIVSVIILNWVTLIPIMVISLLHGSHLATLGDETSEMAFILQVLLGFAAFTGCFDGFIISKCGYRITGLIGAIFYSLGAFGERVATSFAHLVVFISLFKGIGYGLLHILSTTVLTVYFDKKLNLAMGVTQFFIAIGTIIAPPLVTFLNENIGNGNTLWLCAGLSLINFAVIATFKSPVRSSRHVLEPPQTNTGIAGTSGRIVTSESHTPAHTPLLIEEKKIGKATRIWDSAKDWILDGIGFRIFNHLKFWNISFGLAMAYSSDVLFIALIRVTLDSIHYSPEDIGFTMMIFFVSDVVGRISYVAISGFWTTKSRYVFLTVSILISACRTIYILRDDYTWRLIFIICIGWLRAFIETTLPLVISEEYESNFPKAYSMYHILMGSVSLISSPLTSFIKTHIGDDNMVVYVNTGLNFFWYLTWIIELSRVCK